MTTTSFSAQRYKSRSNVSDTPTPSVEGEPAQPKQPPLNLIDDFPLYYGFPPSVSAPIWRLCMDDAKDYDDNMARRWDGTLDPLLIFAGLFSTVLSAFIAACYPQLSPSDPSALQLAVEFLWLLALLLSLLSALGVIVLKLWRTTNFGGFSSDPVTFAIERQTAYEKLVRLGLRRVMELCPALMQAAVVLFIVGLGTFLWPIRPLLGALVVVVVGVVFFSVLGTEVVQARAAGPHRLHRQHHPAASRLLESSIRPFWSDVHTALSHISGRRRAIEVLLTRPHTLPYTNSPLARSPDRNLAIHVLLWHLCASSNREVQEGAVLALGSCSPGKMDGAEWVAVQECLAAWGVQELVDRQFDVLQHMPVEEMRDELGDRLPSIAALMLCCMVSPQTWPVFALASHRRVVSALLVLARGKTDPPHRPNAPFPPPPSTPAFSDDQTLTNGTDDDSPPPSLLAALVLLFISHRQETADDPSRAESFRAAWRAKLVSLISSSPTSAAEEGISAYALTLFFKYLILSRSLPTFSPEQREAILSVARALRERAKGMRGGVPPALGFVVRYFLEVQEGAGGSRESSLLGHKRVENV